MKFRRFPYGMGEMTQFHLLEKVADSTRKRELAGGGREDSLELINR